MKTDEQLKRDVQAKLNWYPSINDKGIVVSAKDGVVTLAGYVPFYADKIFAEKATKSVGGVRGVANDIEVKPNMAHRRPDAAIAEAAVNALKANAGCANSRSHRDNSAGHRFAAATMQSAALAPIVSINSTSTSVSCCLAKDWALASAFFPLARIFSITCS